MQQGIIFGNAFQRHMGAKFGVDMYSTSAIMANVRGKENLVYEYINNMASAFQSVKYGIQENPNGLYADYNSFKKGFVRYWKNALDISKDDLEKLEDIFEDAITTQESCKKCAVMAVFFENGKALIAEDCLYADYDVLRVLL